MYEEKWHDSTWNKDRKLPYWATVFSKDFIAVRPTEDEYEKIFETAWDVAAFQQWMEKLTQMRISHDDINEIEQIITNQNTYCRTPSIQ
jgi:hypothetical protein